MARAAASVVWLPAWRAGHWENAGMESGVVENKKKQRVGGS